MVGITVDAGKQLPTLGEVVVVYTTMLCLNVYFMDTGCRQDFLM
jgi:hypothetical protein